MRSIFVKHKEWIVVATVFVAMLLFLAGCVSAQTELQSYITNLEEKLSKTESTIKVLEQRIEELEKADQYLLTEADVLRIMQGKIYWANVGGRPMQIQFWECRSLGE